MGKTHHQRRRTNDAPDRRARSTFPRSRHLAPRNLSLEPESGARITRARPIIRAQIDDGTGSGVATWRLFVDGVDVSDDATFTNGIVRYEPLTRLSAGTRRVRLEVEDRCGNRANSTWTFTRSFAGAGDPADRQLLRLMPLPLLAPAMSCDSPFARSRTRTSPTRSATWW